MKTILTSLLAKKWFEPFILFVILINCVLIGVETYIQLDWITLVQQAALIVFAIEILIRLIASDSVKSFFKDSWNVFDLGLVLVSLIPESLFGKTHVAGCKHNPWSNPSGPCMCISTEIRRSQGLAIPLCSPRLLPGVLTEISPQNMFIKMNKHTNNDK